MCDKSEKKRFVLTLLFRKVSVDPAIELLRLLLVGYLGIIVINAVSVVFCAFVEAGSVVNQILSFLDVSLSILGGIVRMIPVGSSGTLVSPEKKYENSVLDDVLKLRIRGKIQGAIGQPELVGFNSKATFYSAFAKHFGVTPAKFRRGLPSN